MRQRGASSLDHAVALKNHLTVVRTVKTQNFSQFNFHKFSDLPKPKFVTFDEMIRSRKDEASKSLVIQVNSEKSYQELFNYCSQFGEIKTAFYYNIAEDENNFVLLEFQEVAECEAALRNSQFNTDNPGVPVISPFLWFKATNTKKAKAIALEAKAAPELRCDDTRLLPDTTLIELLKAAENLDDQMTILYRATLLNDLGTRMRFLAAKQLESALSAIFPHVQAHLFGSSVNGFGKMGCDLDFILRVRQDQYKAPPDSRLMFHTKVSLSNERSQTQRQMETIGDIMHLFLPGISNVRRILQARVPIIKFNHECLDLDVDLSMNNLTGLYMSELLYLFGEIDERVRPLTFCVRKWANATGLTNPSPGRWISNFSLTLLVIFFLQRLKVPILPPINLLVKSATKDDIRIADDDINCTFQRDLNHLTFQRENRDSLSYLLVQFFEFYTQFDFSQRSASLLEGAPKLKADAAAMWIVNPLEPLTNVSKNVSFEELERFKLEGKNAAWVLEASHEKSDEPYWGLLNLFKTNKQAIVKPQMFFKSRLVDVSDLFGGKEEPEPQYKNNSIRHEINAIRQTTKREIQKLEAPKMKSKRR